MSRTAINLAVDLVIAALFLAMIATGAILELALPPGTNKSLILWGLTRHQFGHIHLWISFAFLGAILLHVCLHWQWVISVVSKRLGLTASPRQNLLPSGVPALLVLVVAVGLFVWLSRASVREITAIDQVAVCPDSSPAGKGREDRQQAATPTSPAEGSSSPVIVWSDVYSILERNCLSCHGPKRQLAGFRVDRREDFFGKAGSEPQVVAGDSARSPLIAIVSGQRKDMARADAHKLPERNVNLLKVWIDAGAIWPEKPDHER
jgi:hypothetical protein